MAEGNGSEGGGGKSGGNGNAGTVEQVLGVVVDVAFPEELPEIISLGLMGT